MATLSKIIDKLTKQVSLEALGTKDLVEELNTLFNKVEQHEIDLNYYKDQNDRYLETIEGLRKEIVPANEVRENAKVLKKHQKLYIEEKWKFDIEKEYIERENQMKTEMIKSILASKSSNYNDYNGSSSMNYTENIVTPNLSNLSKRATKD